MALDFSQALDASEQKAISKAKAARSQRLSDLPAVGLRWLALAPNWTTPLAEAAQFPAGGSVKSFFDAVVSRGFASTMDVAQEPQIEPATGRLRPSPAETAYAMKPAVARDLVLSAATTTAEPVDVAKDLSAIGSAIQSAESKGVQLDPSLHLWAQLATLADRPSELGDFLLQSVETALQRKTPAGFAEAARCIEAAKPLEQWLHGTLSEALHLAGLRYQLRQRQQDAERYLERFLERHDQIDAFTSLLEAPDDEWALHYVGVGGVGKTMLMRALQTRVGPGRSASIARIDFDYLEPEYPSTKPALMLLHLAEELRLHDKDGVATDYFESFGKKAVTFHEGLTAGAPVRPAVELIRDPEFQLLLDTFANGVRALPPPVVLILDTCEELAKMLPDGSVPDNVAAAFEMLAGVHRRVSSVRVVFSGRRPLGSNGAGGWRARNAASHPTPRAYLRLHEIRGFTDHEAKTYLRDKAKCAERLIPSILQQCQREYSSQFHWPSDSAAVVPADTRYSPYELALYGSWAASDQDLQPEAIKSSNFDQYIRTRIVGRISSDVFRRLLPALTWLGRFDHATVRALALGEKEPDTARLIEEVGRQEWIERQQGQFLEIDRGLRWRVHEFLRTNDPAGLERARAAVAAYLETLTANRPIAELDVSHFEAVVRTLESEPERAALWWEGVEEGLRRSGMYAHLLPITRRLLAEDFWQTTEPSDQRITAAIAATHAAAQLHTGEITRLSDTWQIVEHEADRHPIPATVRRLTLLARAARGVVERIAPEDLDEPSAAALVGFAERHFDSNAVSQATADDWPLDQFIAVASLGALAPVSPTVRAAACVLRGRLSALAGRVEDARSAYQDAFGWSRLLKASTERWLHWLPPDDLPARIQLEFVQWAYPASAAPCDLVWWLEIPPPVTIDADRQGAAVLQLKRAMQPVAVDALAEFRQQSAVTNAAVSTPPIAVLRSVPPLYVVAAEEFGQLGFVPDALNELRGHRSALESTATAFNELLDSDRACVRLQRRYRLLEAGSLVPDGVLTSDAIEDQHARWALDALTARLSPHEFPFDQFAGQVLSPELTHALWNTSQAIDAEGRRRLIAFAGRTLRSARSDEPYLDMSCRLDLAEATQVAAADDSSALVGVRGRAIDVAAWWREHPTRPVEALTLWLRAMALGVASRPTDELVDRVGARRAATIALDEGELLALRSPARALTLLRFATGRFQSAHDSMNALLAEACHALALARLERYEQLDKPIERIRGNFISSRNAASNPAPSRVANEFRTPESWNRIESTVEGSREAWVDVQPAWTHPWLFRIAACLAAHRDGSGGGERCARVAQAWRKFIPALPGEVAGWLDAPRIPVPVRPANEAVTMRAAGTALPTLSGRDGPVPAPDNLALRAIVKRQRSSGSIFESGDVELQDSTGEVLMHFAAPPPDTEYANILTQSQPAWIGYLSADVSPVTLLVDRASAWICWEAVFAGVLPRPKDFVLRRMSTLRVVNVRPSMEPVELGDLTVHTLTGDHAGAELAGSSWKHAPWTYALTPELLEKVGLRKAQVLHIIGDPIETRSGLRLSLTTEASLETKPDFERGRMVSAEEACGLFPNTQLAIIQCPVMRRATRSGVDREKLGYLRTFAAELYAQIPLVVTLPALDFRPATETLACFDRALVDTIARRAAIEKAIVEARDVIRRYANSDEAAFDICFYGAAQ